MSDADVLEGMRTGSSARRYKTTERPVQTARTAEVLVARQRASLSTAARPAVTRTSQQEVTTRVPRPTSLPQVKARTSQAYQQPLLPDTDADVEVRQGVRRSDRPAPPTRQLPPTQQYHQYPHWLASLGLGMVAMLVLWLVMVQIGVWWTNTLHDPSYYTQTAHLDTTIAVTDAQGHKGQVRAFLDAQNRLDLLVLPGNDVSKARVVVGPTLTSINPRQATLIITAHGSLVTVTAQGPYEANFLSFMQPTSKWSIDVKSGGHA